MRGDALVRAIERLDFGLGERQRSRVAAGVDIANDDGSTGIQSVECHQGETGVDLGIRCMRIAAACQAAFKHHVIGNIPIRAGLHSARGHCDTDRIVHAVDGDGERGLVGGQTVGDGVGELILQRFTRRQSLHREIGVVDSIGVAAVGPDLEGTVLADDFRAVGAGRAAGDAGHCAAVGLFPGTDLGNRKGIAFDIAVGG